MESTLTHTVSSARHVLHAPASGNIGGTVQPTTERFAGCTVIHFYAPVNRRCSVKVEARRGGRRASGLWKGTKIAGRSMRSGLLI